MEHIERNLVFAISEFELQTEAKEKIGRTLTKEEVEIAKKGLQFGLLTNIDVIYQTIFTEMI